MKKKKKQTKWKVQHTVAEEAFQRNQFQFDRRAVRIVMKKNDWRKKYNKLNNDFSDIVPLQVER